MARRGCSRTFFFFFSLCWTNEGTWFGEPKSFKISSGWTIRGSGPVAPASNEPDNDGAVLTPMNEPGIKASWPAKKVFQTSYSCQTSMK